MADRGYDYLPPGQTYASGHDTAFAALSLSEMKAMVEYADPEHLREVGDGFAAVRDLLVGGPDGGALGELADIVDTLLSHWEGEAAEGFRRETDRLRRKIAEGAEYAGNTGVSMRGAANALEDYKSHLDAMVPAEGTWDAGASLHVDPRGTADAEALLGRHRGSLKRAERQRLEAAVVMQQLGAAYNSQADTIASWRRESLVSEDFPGPPEGTAPQEKVLPIAYQVSVPNRGADSTDDAAPAGPPGGYGGFGVIAAGAAGIVGGIPRQAPPRRRSVQQRGVIGAADADLRDGSPRQGGLGLRRRRPRHA